MTVTVASRLGLMTLVQSSHRSYWTELTAAAAALAVRRTKAAGHIVEMAYFEVLLLSKTF